MAEIPLSFLVHRAQLKPFLGSGAYGDRYGDPVPGVPCWISHKRRLVRTEGGEEVVSEATVLFRLDRTVDTLPNTMITLHTELPGVPAREAQIITQAVHTDGGMGTWQHVEVTV